ncbi:hypothetical protein Lesp02_15550 [Lentzea sp. NBRC 105346]|uniref:helix-turn-helix domain-containing protein n=1 Tax=Lentzea sp. NBRC 105346 TaxID=3032205 RepID=UPI0024A4F41A|nr:helix-turn-helix domain-containing protein [Lentzea sp. NBRC 105346]GLZ29365.1 hypothetical protein Lesp02_15550 [Lentzea sp. NBRC 105346]
MSVEAISWALNHAPIPTDRKDSSSLAVVLIGLANHADSFGRNSFPSVATLTRYTRLSERTVRATLDRLHALRLIKRSDPDIVAAHIKRADRRPQGWDLAMSGEVHKSHPAEQDGVQSERDEVQSTSQRGASTAPEPSFNRQRNRPAPNGRSAVCGQCDARESDPVSARVVWLDEDRTRSTLCPRCHPQAVMSR